MKTDYGGTLTDSLHDGSETSEPVLGLVIVWSRDEPRRVGEVALLPPGLQGLLGRSDPDAPPELLSFGQQRPGAFHLTGPIGSSRVSRRQLRIEAQASTLTIENVGQAGMAHNGQACTEATVVPGDLIEIERRLSLLCVLRPPTLPGLTARPHRFGSPDAHGVVGESQAAWALREQLAFVARRTAHVLILGESGTGKELAAQAIHAQSERSKGPLVSRNAATLPEGLVDAELFGNAKNYPNPGLPARPGLIGEADRGTLFLDEIGEMPAALQAHLLRVLDRGEYQRLGEATVRRSSLRLVAATNRAPEELKHDFAARMPIVVQLPRLIDRREDVPLLARHLLTVLADGDPELRERFFARGEPRIAQELLRQLVTWPYSTHVRELQSLLWRSMTTSTGQVLEALPEVHTPNVPAPAGLARDVAALTADEIRAALVAADGVKTKAAESLGLRNRFQLLRAMKKHGIE